MMMFHATSGNRELPQTLRALEARGPHAERVGGAQARPKRPKLEATFK